MGQTTDFTVWAATVGATATDSLLAGVSMPSSNILVTNTGGYVLMLTGVNPSYGYYIGTATIASWPGEINWLPEDVLLNVPAPEPPGGWDEDPGAFVLREPPSLAVPPTDILLKCDIRRDPSEDLYWVIFPDGVEVGVAGYEIASSGISVKEAASVLDRVIWERYRLAVPPTYIQEPRHGVAA